MNIDEILVAIIQVYLLTAVALNIINKIILYRIFKKPQLMPMTVLANQATYVSFAWPWIVTKIIVVGHFAIFKIMLNIFFGVQFSQYYSIKFNKVKRTK